MTYRATFILNYNGLLFMDRGAWQATVHGVAKSRTWLRDFTFTFSSETTNTIRQWNNVLNTQTENMCVCVCVLVTQLCPTLWDFTRLLCPWNSPGKNTEVSFYSLLQRIFPTKGLNLGLWPYRWILCCMS